jgi:hypothetical protein
MCTFTSVAEGLSVRGKMVSASSATNVNCSGVKKCKRLDVGVPSMFFALSGAGVCSEQPDKITLARDADIALPVIQAVYLRTSRLFMGKLAFVGVNFIVSLASNWDHPINLHSI